MVDFRSNIIPQVFTLWEHLGYGLILICLKLFIFIIFISFCLFPTDLQKFQKTMFFVKKPYFSRPKILVFWKKISFFAKTIFFVVKFCPKLSNFVIFGFKKNKNMIHVHWVWNIHQNFFWKIVVISAITKGVKHKLSFWQYFFSSACIFGRKIIWPKIFFVRSANTLKSFQNNFQECEIIIEHNKRGPWGGGNPCSPPINSNPDFIRFCAKRGKSFFFYSNSMGQYIFLLFRQYE